MEGLSDCETICKTFLVFNSVKQKCFTLFVKQFGVKNAGQSGNWSAFGCCDGGVRQLMRSEYIRHGMILKQRSARFHCHLNEVLGNQKSGEWLSRRILSPQL